jgi:hypothetical protein
MPVILATQEAEIRRIKFQSQLEANSLEKIPITKKPGGVVQVVRVPA